VLIGRAADAINAAYGNGIGWRLAMLAVLIYIAVGVAAITRLNERPITPAFPQ
jgi:hypothetical protein